MPDLLSPLSTAPHKSAAFFDLDKTILATASSMALRGPFVDAGLVTRRAAIMSVLVHLPYILRGADENRMNEMAKTLGDLAKGIDARRLEATVEESLDSVIDPVCYLEALEEITRHQAEGRPVIVASASALEVVRPIAKRLGADGILATIVAKDEEGAFAGEILHFNQAEGKARACAELAAERGWNLAECWAYSDSISDEPLLASVGHPVAVNPDRALRKIAEEREWRIERFEKKARVGRALPRPPRKAVFGLGCALLAASVAVSVSLRRTSA